MKKRLHVVHFPVFGGPHNEALRLSATLRARGWDTCVLVADEPGDAAQRLRDGGVEVFQKPLGRVRASLNPSIQARLLLGFPSDIKAIRQLIRSERIDLVSLGGLINPHAAFAARMEGVPVVWQIVDSRTPEKLRGPLMTLVRRLADTVMFDGQGLVPLHTSTPLKQPSLIYYPPVDTTRFVPSPDRRHESRRALGLPDDAPVVGMVANFNPQKGIEYFIRAAAHIQRRKPETHFVMIGADYVTQSRYQAMIDSEIAAAGIPPGQLIRTGSRSDLELLYPAMDVKLITSVPRSEGTTTTALEAQACGVPVVATDVGAVAEVVEDGVTGLVVPALQPRAIAEATLRILDNSLLRRRMATAAREAAVARFDIEVCADTHVRAFEAALAHHAARNARLQGAKAA